jgi:hypothetical protein
MRSFTIGSLAVAALSLAFLSGSVVAADPSAGGTSGKGSIKGKVVSADGKPAAGVPVRLMKAGARKAQAGAAAVDGDAAPKGKRPKAGAARQAEPVAETTADASGEFAFADVEPGNYVVMSRMKGVGGARGRVKVSANETASVTLNQVAQGAKKPKGKAKQAA